jgi:hypothetical protein
MWGVVGRSKKNNSRSTSIFMVVHKDLEKPVGIF